MRLLRQEAQPAVEASPSRTLAVLIVNANRRTSRRRRIVIAGLAVLLVGGAITGWLVRPKPLPFAARFRTQAPTSGEIVREVRATGRVDAVASVDVGAEISGRIESVTVDYNSRVKTGDVLARFDRRSLEAQRAQTSALVLSAKAQLAQARFDLQQAKRNRDRATELFNRSSLSQSEHEVSETAYSIATARADAAEASLAAQEAAATLARTNIDHAVIRAPIDGVVVNRNIDAGQTVTAMLQSPVLFSIAADLRKMEVLAAVDEADIAELKPGQSATFTVTAHQDRSFAGTVTEVRYAARVVQDVVTYGVVIAVDNLDLALKPSMTATVRIRTGAVSNVDRVPNAALRFTPPGQEPHAAPGVWTLEQETFVFHPVTAGLSDGELTAVASNELPPARALLIDLTPEGRKYYDLIRRK